MKKTLEPYQLIERSIIKKYRKELWTPFIVAVKRYELVQAGDRIAVCISGGKDSMLMAKLMQELQRHSDVPFELVFLVMDPGYNEINRQKIESNAELLHIPVTIFESNIFAVANNTCLLYTSTQHRKAGCHSNCHHHCHTHRPSKTKRQGLQTRYCVRLSPAACIYVLLYRAVRSRTAGTGPISLDEQTSFVKRRPVCGCLLYTSRCV